MSDIFKVGEIAILQNDPAITFDPEIKRLNGEEVEIIGPLATHILMDGPFYCYPVRHPYYADEFYCAPHELRRRKPPTTGEQSILALFKGTPQREKEPA